MRITLSHPYDHSSSARVFLLARVHVIYLICSSTLAITARLSEVSSVYTSIVLKEYQKKLHKTKTNASITIFSKAPAHAAPMKRISVKRRRCPLPRQRGGGGCMSDGASRGGGRGGRGRASASATGMYSIVPLC